MKFSENETLELKKSTAQLKNGVISIASILNKHGHGELFFGIKDDGTVVGQEVSEKTIRQISQSIAENIEPKIYPEINHIKIKGTDCIHIKFSGGDRPYYAFGRAFIRVGDEDRKLSAKELENMIVEKHREQLRWDREICYDPSIEDISEEKVKRFLKLANLEYSDIPNALEKLNLLKNGYLLNTAVLLFGKDPVKFFPNAKLRCAVFGTTTTAFIIDRQEYTGDVFYLIEKAEEYILKNIHIGMELNGLYRVDVPEISKDAFREAVINAFCHRDYYEYDSVNIAIFKDRLEIRNPGGLFGGLTIEQIKSEMVSRRRNEIIAELFHRIHFVEKWGRGISLILSKEPTADFKEVADLFITTFKRKNYDPDSNDLDTSEITSKKTNKKSSKKVEQQPVVLIRKNNESEKKEPERELVEKLAGGLVERLVDGLVDGLVENQKKMVKLIHGDPHIPKKKMAEVIGISTTAVDKNMETLKKKGLIKRFGNAKHGYWKIVYDQVRDKPEDKNNRLVDGLADGLVEGLAENQEKIIKLIQNDPHISKKKMAEAIGISTTAVDKNIDTLKKQGILKRVGPDKGGHWEIKI
jgi:ATP-dependent DNA helicase RecG